MPNTDFWLLVLSVFLIIILFIYIINRRNRKQLHYIFSINLFCVLVISIGVLCQAIFTNINPILFENFIYIGTCFLPVSIYFTGLIFVNTKIKFKKYYLLFFIVPIISLLVLWTNQYHNLFYVVYSASFQDTIYGPYFYIHTLYSYSLLIVGMLKLFFFSIKNSGLFSKQSILICIGFFCPIIVNILGSVFKLIPMTVFATPIAFSISIICFSLAIFKFNFLSVAPIALQRIVDRISDLYLVINDNFKVIDFNKPFTEATHTTSSNLRNRDVFNLLVEHSDLFITDTELKEAFQSVKSNPSKTIVLEKHSKELKRYFNVEINSIFSNNSFLGILILFKDVTQHMLDMQTIQNSQDILIERERLASLGQMIGGIAHNLKTPIMSISGAAEGISDLIKEYDSSIGDADVTEQDHHDIAHDMSVWVEKIRDYTGYMSDVITAVKGQAVNLSDEEAVSFTLEELVKRVNILMKHELKNAICYLNVSMKVDPSTELNGNINSLVQVINNMISNAIQSYNGAPEKNIDMTLYQENQHIIIAIKDYGPGLPEKVKEKLFKEMITTKGKNGTGLGLFMSYSNIRAHFNGNITFESEEGKGTTFYIELPM